CRRRPALPDAPPNGSMPRHDGRKACQRGQRSEHCETLPPLLGALGMLREIARFRLELRFAPGRERGLNQLRRPRYQRRWHPHFGQREWAKDSEQRRLGERNLARRNLRTAQHSLHHGKYVGTWISPSTSPISTAVHAQNHHEIESDRHGSSDQRRQAADVELRLQKQVTER